MADVLLQNSSQCYNRVERYGNRSAGAAAKCYSNTNYSRKKNNSFSSIQTPEKTSSYSNSVNYHSDNASSYVQSSNKKCRQRRSLSSSPTLNSHYAGAKFSEPPSPSILPLPPMHWIVESSASASDAESTPPRSISPIDFENTIMMNTSCTSTPISKISFPPVNQSVELFFQKCSFNQLETCKDFTQQLKTLLNVRA